jgi:outer membrane protein OmpA-like peptidoglycan-associated protein
MGVRMTVCAAAAALLLGGCATQTFVKEAVAPVQGEVDGLRGRVQAQDDGLRALGGRVQGSEAQIAQLQRDAAERAAAAAKLPGPPGLLMSVVLKDDQIKFARGHGELGGEAAPVLDRLVAQLKQDNQPVFVEIQGHTDTTGPAAFNQQLGLQRAEAVRLYLAKAGLPLARMATISYGASAPLADNTSRDGRALNRRVQLVVMR